MPDQTLAELIAARKGSRSYADLEQASNGRIRDMRWSQMASLPISARWVADPEQVQVIADALGVTPDEVAAAIHASQQVAARA